MNSSICEAPLVSNWCPLISPRNTKLIRLRILRYNSSFSFVKCFSSKFSSAAAAVASTQDELHQSFLASYLIDSCGVSPQRAVDLSGIYANKLRFDTPEKPDSMRASLRNSGFTDHDITKLISYDPVLLSYSEETLLPKIHFFYSIGFTQKELPFFLAKSGLLRHSLNDYIIPLYSMLKDELETEREIVVCMKRLGYVIRKTGYKNIRPNLTLLKEVGVPSSKLAYFVRAYPADLIFHPNDFRGIVDEVKALGFDVTKIFFVHGVHALCPRYETVRDRCSEIYIEWGFSQEDILSAFRKWPQCLLLSENKLRDSLDFLIGKIGCQVEAVVRNPVIVTYNLDERVIPRCSVIHVLTKKGLVRSDLTLGYILNQSEKCFLNRYVYKHTAISSVLLEVYQRKVDPFKELLSVIS
ncbi:hypothetical protein Droror1_Dr00009861 [Drosera rotundifolia]